MWPDRVSNPGPLTYESGALPTALRKGRNARRGPAIKLEKMYGFAKKSESILTIRYRGVTLILKLYL